MRILSVPHLLQEQPASCVPATVRMVLSYLGIERSEFELSVILESEQRGTSILNIDLLENVGLGVSVRSGDFNANQLKQFLDEGLPVVAGIRTGMLSYWKSNRPHAVVVVGYDKQSVYLNDPKFPDAPKVVSWEDFLGAWQGFGNFAAIIIRQPLE